MSNRNTVIAHRYAYAAQNEFPLLTTSPSQDPPTSLLDKDLQLMTQAWRALCESLLTHWEKEQASDTLSGSAARRSPPEAFVQLRILLQNPASSLLVGLGPKATKREVLELEASRELIGWLKALKSQWLSQFASPLIDALIVHASAGHNQQVFNENARCMLQALRWMKQPGSGVSDSVSGQLGLRLGVGVTLGISAAGDLTRSKALGKGGVFTEEYMRAAKLGADVKGTVIPALVDAGFELSGRYRTGERRTYRDMEEYVASQSPLHLNRELKRLLVDSGHGTDPLKRHVNLLNQAHSGRERLNLMLTVIGWPGQTTEFPLLQEGSLSRISGYTGELKFSGGASVLPNKNRLGVAMSANVDVATTEKAEPLSFLQVLDPSTMLTRDEQLQLDLKLAQYNLPETTRWPEVLDALSTRVGMVVQLMELTNGFFDESVQAQALATTQRFMRDEGVASIEQLFGKWSATLYLSLKTMRQRNPDWVAADADLDKLVRQMDQQLGSPRFPHDAGRLQEDRGLVKTTSTREEKYAASLQLDLPGWRGKAQASWRDNKSDDPTQDGEILEISLAMQLGTNIGKLKDVLNQALKKAFPQLIIKLASLELPLQGGGNVTLNYFKPRNGEDTSFRLQETGASLNALSTFGSAVALPLATGIALSAGASRTTTVTKAGPKQFSGCDIYWFLNQYFNSVAAGTLSWSALCNAQQPGLTRLLTELRNRQSLAFVDLAYFVTRYNLHQREKATLRDWESIRSLNTLEALMKAMVPYWRHDKDEKAQLERQSTKL
ncbi:hypothetical protein [Paludibacterium purpuratum]|uniref:Uncharacterized protein n=1 Tax=Paludibacterium purpuratum TaxID=1144873 RepID=A0A4R7B6G0_9NEIS|nr:hypothetical protein [Paludibacterium purpuratum]TDR80274.1 hypothetical protein DFP86_105129 [Paludibacterium purpuratum]